MCVDRKTLRCGQWQQEKSYYITSVMPTEAKPKRLLEWIRGHWKIENQLHHVRDVTFHEDASRVRTGSGPQVFAAIRNALISMFRSQNQTNIAQAIRTASYEIPRKLQTLAEFKL